MKITSEQITKEWIANLSDAERKVAKRLNRAFDFLVLGDAMPFIEEVAPAYGYNIVYVKLQTLDDLRGIPKIYDASGRFYYQYENEWEKAVMSSEKTSLVIFNIDEADNRLVNALKPFIERHGDNYFVGLICSDVTRDLKCTTIYDLVKPVINCDC